ncbi:hypothetical protein SAMN05192550_2964 [Flavobacterium glycines]|uniref:Uncharacterized protein n=1 Tax=Flavobacterium glycines TaxID=551990 RepID=A0A1B9DJG0_9FLAO|nr:hypothetical protein [Flavobacterium glycines]OCB69817.1 hypothetical protein FBGL_12960 [Flavobacterium glycines]GEL12072.1 hypothetical protein FGL01_28110 [Flavobacterium glycines]SDJ89978.1 hypothetical protein SAMN05192550_2964 [Flavobacterium glycines]
MNIEDVIGHFEIIGSNQDAEDDSYKGTLSLSLDRNKRIKARWFINNEQLQTGSGFFRDNILVINFKYQGEDDKIFKGVVVYRCLSKDLLDGFWSEKHGNPLYLGKERAFRITNPSN